MKLKSIEWRNIKSFGNKLQKLDFSEEGGLWMITGANGYGKCLSPKTKLTVHIEDETIRKEFLKFLKK